MSEIYQLSQTSKKISSKIWQNDYLWMNMTKRDFPNSFEKNKSLDLNMWKNLYKRLHKVEYAKATFSFICKSDNSVGKEVNDYSIKWANPSGLMPNRMTGWSLRKDKINSNIAYCFPKSYFYLSPVVCPKKGENHPTIMLKILFSYENMPNVVITEIPWNEDVLGEELFYRKGDGKVNWYNDLYTYKFSFDGGWHHIFEMRSVS